MDTCTWIPCHELMLYPRQYILAFDGWVTETCRQWWLVGCSAASFHCGPE